MSSKNNKYILNGINFYNIRNRNEPKVLEALAYFLDTKEGSALTEELQKDLYALTLNYLTPRYAQTGTIILRDPVRKVDIEKAMLEAYTDIINSPTSHGKP